MAARKPARKGFGKQLAYSGLIILVLLLFVLPTLYANGLLSYYGLEDYFNLALSLLFPFIAFSWMYWKGNTTKQIIESLGITRKSFSLLMLGIGVVIFLIVVLMEVLISAVSSYTGVQINTNAALIFQGAPVWFIIFTSVVGPIDEEIFFRGFAVPRIGVVLSALIFGILHAGYGSTFGVEIIAAFIFGLIAGYVFKKTKSLYPSIVAHILVNSLTASLALVFLHLV